MFFTRVPANLKLHCKIKCFLFPSRTGTCGTCACKVASLFTFGNQLSLRINVQMQYLLHCDKFQRDGHHASNFLKLFRKSSCPQHREGEWTVCCVRGCPRGSRGGGRQRSSGWTRASRGPPDPGRPVNLHPPLLDDQDTRQCCPPVGISQGQRSGVRMSGEGLLNEEGTEFWFY